MSPSENSLEEMISAHCKRIDSLRFESSQFRIKSSDASPPLEIWFRSRESSGAGILAIGYLEF